MSLLAYDRASKVSQPSLVLHVFLLPALRVH